MEDNSHTGMDTNKVIFLSGEGQAGKVAVIPFSGAVKEQIYSPYFGAIIKVHENQDRVLIIPLVCYAIRKDKYERLLSWERIAIDVRTTNRREVQIYTYQSIDADTALSIPTMVFDQQTCCTIDELLAIHPAERKLYRKSNWFYAKKPLDLWNYLINGSLYDPRVHPGIDKRFKCQQCAYAWWSYLEFLREETGKAVYTVLRDEVAYSVLMDMSDSGEWGHGFWSDEIETHTRFHLDGLHLLISQYETTGEQMWLDAAKRGMAFVVKTLVEKFDDGSLWFLHDTIEHKEPYRFYSSLFGKSAGNSLCINTHVQALTVLHRLRAVCSGDTTYADLFERGVQALRRVLGHQPGNVVYKFLDPWVIQQKTDQRFGSSLVRFEARLRRHVVSKLYWIARRSFPRIVHPNGFTERDLTLSFSSDRYHIINLKDFLTLYQLEPLLWLRPYIENGVAFVRKQIDLKKALQRSPYYIEWVDVLQLYDRLIEPVPSEEIQSAEQIIHQQTGGYSLDYYTSGLVRGY